MLEAAEKMITTDNAASGKRQLPYAFALQYGIVVIPRKDLDTGIIELGLRPDSPPEALIEARRVLGKPLICHEADEKEFGKMLEQAYEHDASHNSQVIESIEQNLDLNVLAETLPEQTDLLESENSAPVIKLINALFTDAIKQNASDIHIEPSDKFVSVRFRVDGVLRPIIQLKRTLAPVLVSRIKVMAKLDIAERRLPQDGHIPLGMGDHYYDIRVSTIPASGGERVVLRLLDKNADGAHLKTLGLSEHNLSFVNTLIQQPHGIILITGPTGSGKTTSMYAALRSLNDGKRNILTIEDPVEITLEGIGQTEVNMKTGLTFARGLRAILRQDPDIIMIGEIRDAETAQIAVQASLTGHMVFSSLHTNSAIGAITRLYDMGVEPFLLSSSLAGLAAQRLVRKLCHHCKQPYTASSWEMGWLGLPDEEPLTLYRPEGCFQCRQSGYYGRTGIYEIILIDDEMRKLIHDNAGEAACEAYAREHFGGIKVDACQKIIEGITSIEEILRVIQG